MSLINELITEASVDEKGNKAYHIREALEILGEDSKPGDIVDWVKQNRNVEVTAAYVSLIKSQSKKLVAKQTFSAQCYIAAKALIKAAGSIGQAKAVLSAMDIDREFVGAMSERYNSRAQELEQILASSEEISKTARREMTNEVRRLRKLINSLNEVESC